MDDLHSHDIPHDHDSKNENLIDVKNSGWKSHWQLLLATAILTVIYLPESKVKTRKPL